MERITIIIGLIVVSIGIILCYDARKISKKWFSFYESNEVTKVLKIVGAIIGVIGGIISIVGI